MNNLIFVFQVISKNKELFIKVIDLDKFELTTLEKASIWESKSHILSWKRAITKQFHDAIIRKCKLKRILI